MEGMEGRGLASGFLPLECSDQIRLLVLIITFGVEMAEFDKADPRWLVKDMGQGGTNVNNWHWREYDG